MAWNKYYLMISDQPDPITAEELEQLGLGAYQEWETANLYDTNKPDTLFTAHFNGAIIVVHPELAFEFIKEEQSAVEKAFIRTFPEATIAALVENATVALFGFALIERGEKVRVKSGSDGEIYVDSGSPLPEEAESLRDFASFMMEEERKYLLADLGKRGYEEYVAFEAAWSVPNLLSRRFLGETVGAINGKQIVFTRYEVR